MNFSKYLTIEDYNNFTKSVTHKYDLKNAIYAEYDKKYNITHGTFKLFCGSSIVIPNTRAAYIVSTTPYGVIFLDIYASLFNAYELSLAYC